MCFCILNERLWNFYSLQQKNDKNFLNDNVYISNIRNLFNHTDWCHPVDSVHKHWCAGVKSLYYSFKNSKMSLVCHVVFFFFSFLLYLKLFQLTGC